MYHLSQSIIRPYVYRAYWKYANPIEKFICSLIAEHEEALFTENIGEMKESRGKII
jgi:hypothetical protein